MGVFVNARLDEIASAVEDEGLTMVQLHGDERIPGLAAMGTSQVV